MIPHQVRNLLVVFIIVGAALIIVRQYLIPPTFGELGHYRASVLDTIASQELQYAGHQSCVECHLDVEEVKRASYHRGLSCEICHGPAYKHTQAPDEYQPIIPEKRANCTICHEYNPSRPTGFPQIDPLSHNPNKRCMSCHEPHDPRPPHVPGECSACHAEISRMKSISHHARLECTTCHETEEEHKISPRTIRPTKPAAREFCGGCHAKGAGSPREIPRVDLDTHGFGYVCWQCHYPHYPEVR
ncbi:MAG: multiheme c-type cytochrome [Candidatus Glassbacteria bacterium]